MNIKFILYFQWHEILFLKLFFNFCECEASHETQKRFKCVFDNVINNNACMKIVFIDNFRDILCTL